MKKIFISTAIYVVNIMAHMGAAGLIATGIYLLNSYFGWAADVPAWRVTDSCWIRLDKHFLHLL